MNFTNLPYVPDAGPGCGAGFVNPGNVLDGVSIVGGHEYAETLTDEFPAGGWTANDGEEIGDLCAWKTSGGGKTQNLALTTGTFAVQGLWSNRANTGFGGCVIKQAQL
jgi:serine protease